MRGAPKNEEKDVVILATTAGDRDLATWTVSDPPDPVVEGDHGV